MLSTKRVDKKPKQEPEPNNKTFVPTIGIIDDDPIVANCMRARIKLRFPDCSIQLSTEPVPPPLLNIYFIDNDFNGIRIAVDLLQEIRRLNPEALVIAMSSTLDSKTLRQLMNRGCNAVYDKSTPHESSDVFEVVRNYLNLLRELEARKQMRNVSTIASSLSRLLQDWNTRLGSN